MEGDFNKQDGQHDIDVIISRLIKNYGNTHVASMSKDLTSWYNYKWGNYAYLMDDGAKHGGIKNEIYLRNINSFHEQVLHVHEMSNNDISLEYIENEIIKQKHTIEEISNSIYNIDIAYKHEYEIDDECIAISRKLKLIGNTEDIIELNENIELHQGNVVEMKDLMTEGEREECEIIVKKILDDFKCLKENFENRRIEVEENIIKLDKIELIVEKIESSMNFQMVQGYGKKKEKEKERERKVSYVDDEAQVKCGTLTLKDPIEYGIGTNTFNIHFTSSFHDFK